MRFPNREKTVSGRDSAYINCDVSVVEPSHDTDCDEQELEDN